MLEPIDGLSVVVRHRHRADEVETLVGFGRAYRHGERTRALDNRGRVHQRIGRDGAQGAGILSPME